MRPTFEKGKWSEPVPYHLHVHVEWRTRTGRTFWLDDQEPFVGYTGTSVGDALDNLAAAFDGKPGDSGGIVRLIPRNCYPVEAVA